jgi:ferredoxin
MAKRLRIDLEQCIRSGECYYNHPELMQMSEDGTPKLLIAVINTERERIEAEQAIEVCPARAISLVDE